MKKYTISFSEVLYYLATDIEASSREEAIEKAFEMMDSGNIEVANSNMDYTLDCSKEKQNEEI